MTAKERVRLDQDDLKKVSCFIISYKYCVVIFQGKSELI